jgi:hypothetical protein
MFVIAALAFTAKNNISAGKANRMLSQMEFLKIARRFNTGNKLETKSVPHGQLNRWSPVVAK